MRNNTNFHIENAPKSISPRSISLHLTTVAICSLWLTPTASFAQQDMAQKELEVVVVTAQRREQNTQDVAMSLSVMGETTLEKLGADSLQEYAIGLPNVTFYGSSASQRIGIRGVMPTAAGAPTVAIYLDETPIVASATEDSRALVDPRVFDIDRIEVLRGPQGSLYGSSTLGGLIKIVTNRPDSSGFSAKVDTSLSTTDSGDENLELNGMVNIPLVADELALRLVASHRRMSGFIDRLPGGADQMFAPLTAADTGPTSQQLSQIQKNVNDIESTSFRAALMWTPNDQLSVQARAWVQDSKDDSRPLTRPLITTPGGFAAPILTPVGSERRTSKFVDEPLDTRFYNYSLELNYDLDFGTVTSSTTYTKVDRHEEFDLSRLNIFFGDLAHEVDISDTETKNFSQEIRFQSKFDGRLQILAGAFYANREETIIERDRSIAAPQFGLPFGLVTILTGGLLGDDDPPFFGCYLCLDAYRNNDEIGLFGNVTFDLTEQLNLEAGLRWYDFKITGRTENVISLFGDYAFDPNFRIDENGVIPTASISYHLSGETMAFARVAKGFRPGSLALISIFDRMGCADDLEAIGIPADAISNPLDSDTLWDYEAGIKTTLFDKRLTVNAVGFLLDWKDRPESILLGCGETARINNGKAKNIGFDIDFQALVAENFVVSGGLGYVDAEYRTEEPGTGIVNGDPLFDVPKWTYNIAGEYYFQVFNGLPAYFRVAWRYLGDRPNSAPGVELDGFGVLNLRAGLEINGWNVALFAENATDKNGVTFSSTTFGIFQNNAIIRPRTIGVNIQRNF